MISYGKIRENSFPYENMFFRKGEENWQTGSRHTEEYISFHWTRKQIKLRSQTWHMLFR